MMNPAVVGLLQANGRRSAQDADRQAHAATHRVAPEERRRSRGVSADAKHRRFGPESLRGGQSVPATLILLFSVDRAGRESGDRRVGDVHSRRGSPPCVHCGSSHRLRSGRRPTCSSSRCSSPISRRRRRNRPAMRRRRRSSRSTRALDRLLLVCGVLPVFARVAAVHRCVLPTRTPGVIAGRLQPAPPVSDGTGRRHHLDGRDVHVVIGLRRRRLHALRVLVAAPVPVMSILWPTCGVRFGFAVTMPIIFGPFSAVLATTNVSGAGALLQAAGHRVLFAGAEALS